MAGVERGGEGQISKVVCKFKVVTLTQIRSQLSVVRTEVEFLEEIQTEVLRVFLLAIHRHLY
jgi:hypothetical protein